MTTRYFSICAFIILSIAGFGQTPITFTVDIAGTGLTPAATGVHIAGNFQDPNFDGSVVNPSYTNWSPSSIPMNDNGNGTFSITLNLLPERYEFKFINGNNWNNVEDPPNICQVELNGNDNRYIEVGTTPLTYSVCFGSCSLCGTNAVLFRVDMSMVDSDGDGIYAEVGEDISPAGVHVAGNFADPNYDNQVDNPSYANWNPGFISLNALGNGVYGVILQLVSGNYDYKFINGDSWGFEEPLNGPCFFNGNRQLVVDQPNILTGPYCFSSCTACILPTSVTFRVDMGNEEISPNGIHIAGSMQGWNPGDPSWAMNDMGNNVFEITKAMQSGDYQFKFINGNNWSGSDNYPENTPEECSQSGNRFVTISGNSMILEYCFNQCSSNCSPIPPPVIFGCLDSSAFNYNPIANTDDGSCIPIVQGCTNPLALNFNELANTDNGSCIDAVQGCMNPNACNYNALANISDNSCLFNNEPCNDELISTVNDIINEMCTCAGTPTDLNGNNENTYQGLFYQAVARNADGTPMANQNISIRFSLHQSSATGAIEYQEVQNVSSNAMGLFTTFFGTGQAVIGNFSNIQWGVNAKYLQVEMDINGWQTIGTQQLAAVPYAIRAKEVDAGGLKLQSPNGNCYILQVNNNGSLSTLQVPCD